MGHVARIGEIINLHKIVVTKPVRKESGKLTFACEDIMMNLFKNIIIGVD